MTQELVDLRNSILEGRYEDALIIVDELEDMSKRAIIRNIMSFLIRLMIHLIKNQLEQRLTNSWIASISNSVIEIQSLNLKDNRKSCLGARSQASPLGGFRDLKELAFASYADAGSHRYYIKQDEWNNYLEEAIERAIRPASVEVMDGKLKASAISSQIIREDIIQISHQLLRLTYQYSAKELPLEIDRVLAQLPGGDEWFN